MKTVICRDLWRKGTRVPTSKLSFRPSVYGVILRGDTVLLLRQFDGYDFPGGGVHLGETIEQALKREVWEETGLRVMQGSLLGVFEDFFTWTHPKHYYHSLLFIISAQMCVGKFLHDILAYMNGSMRIKPSGCRSRRRNI